MRTKLLLIEPDRSLRQLLMLYLSKEFHVVSASDGLKALAWLMKGEIPAVILLDGSAGEFEGLSLIAKLRCSGMFRDIPVIAMGVSTDEERQQFAQAGAKVCLVKPLDVEALRQHINALTMHPVNAAMA